MADVPLLLKYKAIKHRPVSARDTVLQGFVVVASQRKKTVTVRGTLRPDEKRTAAISRIDRRCQRYLDVRGSDNSEGLSVEFCRGQHPTAERWEAGRGGLQLRARGEAGRQPRALLAEPCARALNSLWNQGTS
jgi:hypothetical protein